MEPPDKATEESRARGRRRGWLINALLVFVSLSAALGVSEFVLRRYEDRLLYSKFSPEPLADPARTALNNVRGDQEAAFQWRGDGNGLFHVRSQDRTLVYEMRPSTRLNDVIATNAAGFRDHEFSAEKPPGAFRIAAVGDSLTFGWNERLQDTFPKLLEFLLNRAAAPNHSFEVFNMGVGGYNAEQEVEVIRTKALEFHPDLILIQYCINDKETGADVGLWRHFSRTWLRTWDFFRLRWMQVRDRLAKEGQQERSYRRLAELSRQLNLPVVVAIFPALQDDTHIAQRMDEFVRGLGLPVVYLASAFDEMGMKNVMGADVYHPNSFGHRIAAEEIFQHLRRQLGPPAIEWRDTGVADFAPARRLFRDGSAALESGDTETASRRYREAAAIDDDYGRLAAQRLDASARTLTEAKAPDKAVDLARTAIGLAPGHADAYKALGLALQAAGDARNAVGAYRRAMELGCDQIDLREHLADALAAQGEVEEAIRAYLEVITADPDARTPYENLDALMLQRVPPGVRLNRWREIVASHPGVACSVFFLAASLEAAGDFKGAADALEQTLSLNPGYWSSVGQIFRRMTGALAAKGDQDGARAMCARAARAAGPVPQDAEMLEVLGQILQTGGDLDGAVAAYRRAVALGSKGVGLQQRLGDALAAQGDMEGAVQAYLEMIAADPNAQTPYESVDSLLRQRATPEGRLNHWRDIVASHPGVARSEFFLAASLEAVEDYEGAAQALEQVMALDPASGDRVGSVFLRIELGQARKGDVNGALATCGRAIAADKDGMWGILSKGVQLELQGQHAEALQAFRAAAAWDPKKFPCQEVDDLIVFSKDPDGRVELWRHMTEQYPDARDPYFHLGVALEAKGDLDGAIVAYRKLLSLDASGAFTHGNLGQLLVRKGDFQGAIDPLRTALRLDPGFWNIRAPLIRALCETKQYDAAWEEVARSREAGVAVPDEVLQQLEQASGRKEPSSR